MKEYRIKELKFEDGRCEFYPQYLGKGLQQFRNDFDITEVRFDKVDVWVTLNDGGLPNNTYEEALGVINYDRRSMVLTEEKIHVVI